MTRAKLGAALCALALAPWRGVIASQARASAGVQWHVRDAHGGACEAGFKCCKRKGHPGQAPVCVLKADIPVLSAGQFFSFGIASGKAACAKFHARADKEDLGGWERASVCGKHHEHYAWDGEEDGRFQTAGRDGCPAAWQSKCCAPARWTGQDQTRDFKFDEFEPACVRKSDIQIGHAFACAKVVHLRTVWVSAPKTGQACRGISAPRLQWGADAWKRIRPALPWQSDAPQGGVALHRFGVHYWPSVGMPCKLRGDRFLDALDTLRQKAWQFGNETLRVNEKRGCWLFDFHRKQPMWQIDQTADVHWNGGKDVSELEYYTHRTQTTSRSYPFPAWCARATVSILSTVYTNAFRQADLPPGAKVLLKSFHYSDAKCKDVTREKYNKALEKTRRRASCWNFSDDFITVLCFRFRSFRNCACTEGVCDDVNVACCRSGFSDFLADSNLTQEYVDIAHEFSGDHGVGFMQPLLLQA